MALVTPLSALPASGSTPAGTLTLSNLQGRLTVVLTSGGAAQLDLIMQTEGGAWAYVPGARLTVNSQADLGDGIGWLDFDNVATTTKYHCVLVSGSAACSVYLSSLTGPGTSTALVAHASTHLAGGADDLLGAPGTVGGVTPGVYCGTFGPTSGNQNTVPSVNGDTFALLAASQTLTNKTLTAPVLNGATSTSGNFNLSGSTGTFLTPTGAVTIGGGAAAITATSSAAAITLTAGASSTWSTSAGTLTESGATGINLQRNAATLVDVGATSATAVTLAANISLAGAAGSGGLSLGSMTGATALPTGALSWAGAANQNLSLVGSGTGTVAINNASTMSIGTSGTTTLTLGRSGQSTVLAGNVSFSAATRAAAAAFTIADPGDAGAIPVTTDGVCALTSAGAETRTLAIPTFMGQRLSLVCDTYVGNIVVTSSQALNQAGNTIMTFGAVRDYIALEAITVGGALRWQVASNDGVALS
jgi:hypothetical protein